MENQNWEQFKSEIKKQLLILPKSPNVNMHLDVAKATADYNKFGRIIQDTLVELNSRLLKKPEDFVGRHSTAVAMASYLWSYEGSYILCVDEICALFVINGHDLFDILKRKYAVTFEDITNVDVSTKLKFLEAHNLEFLNRKHDRRLRNKLAHHDFLLNKDGILEVEGARVNIFQRTEELLNFCTKVMNILADCYNEAVDEMAR